MLEVAKLFLETLAKVVPGLKGLQDRNKRAEIGAELFNFYNAVNEMLINGVELTESLRVYVERMERNSRQAGDFRASSAGYWLHGNVQRQAKALGAIATSFSYLWESLSPIVDTSTFQRLASLLGAKTSAIRQLQELMESGQVPFDPRFGFENLIAIDRTESTELDRHEQELLALKNYEDGLSVVPYNVPWEATILAVVKDYLESRQPEQQLAQMTEDLETIRRAIIENFDISDILVKFDGERRKRGPRYPV